MDRQQTYCRWWSVFLFAVFPRSSLYTIERTETRPSLCVATSILNCSAVVGVLLFLVHTMTYTHYNFPCYFFVSKFHGVYCQGRPESLLTYERIYTPMLVSSTTILLPYTYTPLFVACASSPSPAPSMCCVSTSIDAVIIIPSPHPVLSEASVAMSKCMHRSLC